MLQRVLCLALAGALGTLARYGVASAVHRYAGASFPLGTLAANTIGCFLVGLLLALFEHRWPISGETRLLILVGFMGAFTTFSAFVQETGELLRAAEWVMAAGNILLQNGLGLVALFAGIIIGRWL